jgi:hypothetical protein
LNSKDERIGRAIEAWEGKFAGERRIFRITAPADSLPAASVTAEIRAAVDLGPA